MAIDRGINSLNEKIGYAAALLNVPLVGVVVYEVIMRYVFNSPTLWAFEMTNFIFGVNFVLGFSYAHRYDGHVAVDVVEGRLPSKGRLWLRIVVNLALFFPTTLIFAVGSIIYATDSWKVWERNSTSWAPPLYPYKTFMAIGFVLLVLQGLSKLVADVRSLRAHNAKAAALAGGVSGGAQ